MLLLLTQDFPDVLGDGVFLERFALAQALAVVANRGVLVVEVRTQHLARLV